MSKNEVVLKWGWQELERLLLCPICLELPVGIAEQCQHGHHICSKCKPQVQKCPLCKHKYQGTRNYVVEELIQNLPIIKKSMLLKGTVEENKKNKNGACSRVRLTKLLRPLPTPNNTKGLYPCTVVNCNVKLPLCRLLNHVRTFHYDVLSEGIADKFNNYKISWEEELCESVKYIKTISRVFFISGIGLLFVNIEFLSTGDTIGYIQLATQYKEAQKFVGTLQFYSNDEKILFKARMVSIRDSRNNLLRGKLCLIGRKSIMKRIMHNNNNKLNVQLEISRCDGADDDDVEEVKFNDNNVVHLIADLRETLITKMTNKIEDNTKENGQELEPSVKNNVKINKKIIKNKKKNTVKKNKKGNK